MEIGQNDHFENGIKLGDQNKKILDLRDQNKNNPKL